MILFSYRPLTQNQEVSKLPVGNSSNCLGSTNSLEVIGTITKTINVASATFTGSSGFFQSANIVTLTGTNLSASNLTTTHTGAYNYMYYVTGTFAYFTSITGTSLIDVALPKEHLTQEHHVSLLQLPEQILLLHHK